MPKIVIKNRRPASDQPAFDPIPDYLLPLADTTTGNVTLPASLGGDVLTPGQSVTKTYQYLTTTDLNTLLDLVRAGQINFPGSVNIPKGLRNGDMAFVLNGEEPASPVAGNRIYSVYDNCHRVFDGNAWVSEDYDSWKPYSTLGSAQARNFHRLVELPNGEILILGGYANYANAALTAVIPAGKTNAGQLGSFCQRFDPKTGKLTNSCPMPSNNVGVTNGGRAAMIAVLLPNGLVFAGGGQNFDLGGLDNPAFCLADFWAYDYLTDDWTAKATAPETMSPSGAQFALLDDGIVIVAGPQSPGAHTWPSGAGATTLEKVRFNFNTHTFTYDYLTDAWTQRGNLNKRRCFANFIKLDNGQVLIWSGRLDFQESGICGFDGEIWDPVTGNWTLTAAMPGASTEEKIAPATYGPAPITSLTDGPTPFGNKSNPVMACRINGFTVTKDMIGGTIQIASATNALNNITATIHNVLQDTVGGFAVVYYYNNSAVTNNLTQATNPGSATTYTIIETPVGRRFNPMVSKLPGNKVLIAGGWSSPALYLGNTGAYSISGATVTDIVPNSQMSRKSTFVYDVATDSYERVGDMVIPCMGCRTVPLPDGKVAAVFGLSFNIARLANTQIYDPALKAWFDGALGDPVLDGSGNPVMFNGFAGNPGTGTAVAPGFIQGRTGSGARTDFGLLELSSGQLLVFMGMETHTPNAPVTSRRAVLYTPGELYSKGFNMRHIP